MAELTACCPMFWMTASSECWVISNTGADHEMSPRAKPCSCKEGKAVEIALNARSLSAIEAHDYCCPSFCR